MYTAVLLAFIKKELPMLKLYGFSSSNYYNVPKLALLEKNVAFDEVVSYTGVGPKYRPEYLDKSPLGKVPALETPEGFISESRAILEYIERAHPEHSLLPDSPFKVGKVQELAQFIELYFELVARRVIPNLISGSKPDAKVMSEVTEGLTKASSALAKLSDFKTFAYGETFTLADIAAVLNLPVVRSVGKQFIGKDLLSDVPGLDAYCARMEKRQTVMQIRKDAAADGPGFRAHLSKLYGI
jgi:glutathione S-transferase